MLCGEEKLHPKLDRRYWKIETFAVESRAGWTVDNATIQMTNHNVS